MMTQITKLKHDKYILYVWKAATVLYLTVNNKDFYFQEYSLYYILHESICYEALNKKLTVTRNEN